MEIKSVRNSVAKYPTLDEVLTYPELLEKNAPARWLKNGAVAGALSVYLLAGCKSSDNAGNKKHRIELSATESGKSDKSIYAQDTAAKKIAPIFVHGTGGAAFGCIVMSSPTFLSESDAKSIIVDEFKKYGIRFSSGAPSVLVDIERWEYNQNKRKHELIPKEVEIELDGYNEDLNLVFAYISSDEGESLDNNSGAIESVSGFSTKHSAILITEMLKKENKYNAAIFYDPIEDEILRDPKTHEILSSSEANAIRRAKTKLRAQVADFIAWAKKEGLIK